MGPEVMFPMPRVNAKIEKTKVRATGSSTEYDISVACQFINETTYLR